MSTRSKTKALAAAAAAAAVATDSPSSSNGGRSSSRVRKVPPSKEVSQPDANLNTLKKKARPKTQTPKTAKAANTNTNTPKSRKKAYCLCKGPDDGTPMVQCSECKDWFHLQCVNLTEKDAKDISQYVCPTCSEKTGHSAIVETKSPDVADVVKEDQPDPPQAEPAQEPKALEPPEPVSESEPSSEDDYVAESEKTVKGKKSSVGKRPVRRLSLSSESGSSVGDGKQSSRSRRFSTSKGSLEHKESTSSHSVGNLKRKQHPMVPPPPQPKRKRSESNATEDPTRKYCLSKLQEIFNQIFLKYPHLLSQDGDIQVQKTPEDLTEEDREFLQNEAKNFATELERCVYEIYAEPDKQGRPLAGGKYKERFRMIHFNLSKPDRAVLHKRIASLNITPKEISLMSSTDLADEETQQSIKIAEKESLEHSILQKTKVPLAKITHKGLQEIEDLNGGARIEREIEREQEEEERRGRERVARQRAAQAPQQHSSTSTLMKSQGSVPPESPVVPHTPIWGGPPPLPQHAMHSPSDSEPSPVFSRSPENSLFSNAPPDFAQPEPELNLDELIIIDEDPTPQDGALPTTFPSPVAPTSTSVAVSPLTTHTSEPSSTTPTGISPFAANTPKTETPTRATFDLNALWTAPKTEVPTSKSPSAQRTTDQHKSSFMDRELLGPEADDQDFDMFLEKDHDENGGGYAPNAPEAQQAAFDALPQVWSGMINMPLDSTIPQETRVVARQIGGRSIAVDSPLWRTLFPSELLRIDGRVPVDKSSQFLLQMRMNPTKELIGVTFSPGSESSDAGFHILTDFLIAKSRHGLVFPWGNRPKDHHPGRELYIIPLLSSDPLPDYMELLDDLHLPKIRKSNYLIGIWVLNKGKLVPPPAPPAPVSLMQPAMVPLTSNNIPLSASLAPVPALPPLPLPQQAPLSLGHIAPATLAAEVASLTPEQIQLMLQTLASATASTSALPLPIVNPSAPPQPNHLPPQPPLSVIPANPPQPWSSHPPLPGFPIPYQAPPPPPPTQQPPPPPPPPTLTNPQPQYQSTGPGYDRNERGRDYRGPNYERGDWGASGGGAGDRHRGRGRGRGRGRAQSPLKPVDSGWPRNRVRNDSNGGGGGPSSPTRGRWGESWQ